MMMTRTMNIKAVHMNPSHSASQCAFLCRPRVFLTLLSPALGLVFPNQPFRRGKSRFWTPRYHNSKGEGYFVDMSSS